MGSMTESAVEEAALEWFEGLGCAIAHGPDIAADGSRPERSSYAEVVLDERLRTALTKINPAIPPDAIDEAIRSVLRHETPSLVENNQRFHRLLTEGVDVEYRRPDGSVKGDKVHLFDFDEPDNNDWLAVNQIPRDRPPRWPPPSGSRGARGT